VNADDPVAYLFGLERLGMKFGLENISRLCGALGHPERSFRSVIVAGTNGKGSVTVMVETALRAAGHRAARYTSPHLLRLEERFVMDGVEVSTGALREAAGRVRSAVESLQRTGDLSAPPTFFECTTAVAFELFREAAIDIAVLEVGLGGRLDATNVVMPLAAAITTIDLEHQAQLGTTIESIAREKAGVIKPGIPVVCGALAPNAARVMEEVCRTQGARMVRAHDRVRITPVGGADSRVAGIHSARRGLDRVTLALAGRHQQDNATVVVALLDELDAMGIAVGDDAVRAGVSEAVWPARLEHVNWREADVLLDAAHNPAGARALAAYLRDIGWTNVTLVFGTMRDKDVAGMAAALAPLCGTIVCTTAPSPRAMSAAELTEAARAAAGPTTRIDTVPDPETALNRAHAAGGRIVVAGSIFLIGPLRAILR
jgi:dihydrofolate synthase/folylpolyglutamate synthase